MNVTLKAILNDKNFSKKVIKNSSLMGMDEALYFTIGEYQSLNNDNDDCYFLEDAPIEKIIEKYPELEF